MGYVFVLIIMMYNLITTNQGHEDHKNHQCRIECILWHILYGSGNNIKVKQTQCPIYTPIDVEDDITMMRLQFTHFQLEGITTASRDDI